MHKIEFIESALLLLDKYDGQLSKTARELKINPRTLQSWRDKRKAGLPLIIRTKKRSSKWSKDEIKIAVDYYFEHGESASKTVRKLGYPARTTLRSWFYEDQRWKQKHQVHKQQTLLSNEEKENAIIDLINRDSSAKDVADKYNVNRVSLYQWQKQLTGESVMKKDKDNKSKEQLLSEIELLKKEHKKLELENKVLKKANELLKKEVGINYSNLTNKEKTLVVNALKNTFKIKELLEIICLKKSTYFYEIKRIDNDKYSLLRKQIKEIFLDNYECYGYRRIKNALNDINIVVSEKVILRLMKEENIKVYVPKKKKYSSYRGEISPEVENVVNRKFLVDEPHKQALTDITEFALKDGKVYLSPLIDCFDGAPICWTLGKSPNSELTNTMLKEANIIVGETGLLIHSDRGFHYRLDSWIQLMNAFGYKRSMSKKGCSPDNSMCEGFFGTIKNEFFYSKDWRDTCCDDFIIELNKYIKWFKEKRIKKRLGYLSPSNYMINYNKKV